MRVFLAVSCGERFTQALTTALDNWRTLNPGPVSVRWTDPATWHLTLHFLGDWPENHLKDLETALYATDLPQEFSLEAGLLGGFPDLKDPRVLFLHIPSDGPLAQLAAEVRKTVNRTWPDGPQDNRPFRGHLTLARIRAKLPSGYVTLLQGKDLGSLPPIPVGGFGLVVSQLGPQGSEHSEWAFFPLRK